MSFSWLELFKISLRNLYNNKFYYVITAGLLQLFMMTLGIFLISCVFKIVLFVSGQTNLSLDTVYDIILNPFSVVILIIFLFFIAFLMFFEFSILTLMIYGRMKNTHFSIKTVMMHTVHNVKQLAGKQFIVFLIYVISMIPLANLGFSSFLSEQVYIPKFITGEIMKTTSGSIMYVSILCALFYINLRLIMAIPLTVTNDLTFTQNIKLSWQLTRKNMLKLVTMVASFELVVLAIALVIIVVIIAVFSIIDTSGNNIIAESIFYSFMHYIIFFVNIFLKLGIFIPLVELLIVEQQVSHRLAKHKRDPHFSKKTLSTILALVVTGSFMINTYKIYTTTTNQHQLIIAHRGYVSHAVENSIEALEAAAAAHADYVELDIIMTKDHKFVVMHDFNLKRLAGIDKKVQDMTFDEVVGLPIHQNGYSSTIPSFEEFVAKAKSLNIKLLVELKPHGAEPTNYIDIFIDEMKKLQVDTEYKVMSLNLNVMEKLENKAPYFDTGHIIPLQFGDFSNSNINFFVIEDFSYRPNLVLQAHHNQKQVFVWTINEETTMVKYLYSRLDGIITDFPEQVLSNKKEMENNNNYFEKALTLLSI